MVIGIGMAFSINFYFYFDYYNHYYSYCHFSHISFFNNPNIISQTLLLTFREPLDSSLLKSQYFFQELSWIHTDHKTLFLHRQVWAEYFYHFQNTQTPFPYHVQILRRLFV